jgi:hypothetical protein
LFDGRGNHPRFHFCHFVFIASRVAGRSTVINLSVRSGAPGTTITAWTYLRISATIP